MIQKISSGIAEARLTWQQVAQLLLIARGFELSNIALAIAVALFIQVTMSTTLGGLLPILARAFKLDPAVLVSPVLASIVDISGMWIYFTVVNYFLGIA